LTFDKSYGIFINNAQKQYVDTNKMDTQLPGNQDPVDDCTHWVGKI